MRRWLAAAPLAALVALSVLFAGYALHHDPQFKPDALIGKPVPTLSLPRLDGTGTADLKSLVGQARRPVLINLFASWCAPCAAEAPELDAFKAAGVPVIGVAYKDDPKNTQAFLDRLGDPFQAVLVDRSGDAGIEFGASGVPETFLVGTDGRILAKQTGPFSPEQVQSWLGRPELRP